MFGRIYLLDINKLSKSILFEINTLHFDASTGYHCSYKSNSEYPRDPNLTP